MALQIIAASVLVLAIGWRSRRWRMLWVPASVLLGVLAAGGTYWYFDWSGLVGHAAPPMLWIWTMLTGLAWGVLIFGWRNNRRWRLVVSVLAVLCCLLCVALMANLWTGYASTVQSAWDQLTGRPLPGEMDQTFVTAMKQRGDKPTTGVVVSVAIPDNGAGFEHRRELVYLPPAWFAGNPSPRLPAIMMVGGEFGTPADWLYAGLARKTIDEFAAEHAGISPVLVFVDAAGAFSNDTECVNGRRGNVADHLTKDAVPYVISHFGVSSDPANWGIVGWSMGGTCAMNLALKYPELFSAFVDIDGDLFPNAGDREQTIARLFDGHANAFASFDPTTVIIDHGRYTGLAGWFGVSATIATVHHDGTVGEAAAGQVPRPQDTPNVAKYLCALASGHGVECSVVAQGGKHDWQSGAQAFKDALPWLAGKIGTPAALQVPLPGAAAALQPH
jgi:S-formylglutathione hydrolase FrmB